MNKIKYRTKYHKWRNESNYSIISNDNLELFFLDEVSTNIYALFIKPKDIGEAVQIIIDEAMYDVERDVLEQDVKILMKQLISLNLMEAV